MKCSKCVSVSHSTCVSPECLPAYAFAHCTNPNFPFTNNGDSNKKGWGIDRNLCSITPHSRLVVKLSTAKAIVAAAQISSLFMNRFAMIARGEADRRVIDSSNAKRRASDALVKSFKFRAPKHRTQTLCLSLGKHPFETDEPLFSLKKEKVYIERRL
ncbi:hypothetical protein AMTRI_Chr03g140420 [Amborella trichopoda]